MELIEKLRKAVATGDVELVQDLISKSPQRAVRAALSSKTDDQWTLLMKAAMEGHTDIVNLFLAAGAAIDDGVGGVTALMAACMLAPPPAAPEVVTALLEAKANPNVVDRFRETCLIKAAARGLPDVLHILIKEGAQLDAQDNSGYTALYHAAKGGHISAVRCLVQAGADDESKKAALVVAEAKEFKDIIAILAPEAGLDEEEEYVVVLPERFAFRQKVLTELPVGDGRVGFPNDVYMLLAGAGQGFYATSLLNAGFGAAQLITADDEDLRAAGVRFAPQRSLIMKAMVRLALRGWSETSLPQVTTITNAVHALCSALRQIHVMWATTILGRKRFDLDDKDEPDAGGVWTKKSIDVTALAIQQAEEIRRRAANIAKLADRKMRADPAPPADLLRPGV